MNGLVEVEIANNVMENEISAKLFPIKFQTVTNDCVVCHNTRQNKVT